MPLCLIPAECTLLIQTLYGFGYNLYIRPCAGLPVNIMAVYTVIFLQNKVILSKNKTPRQYGFKF